MRWALLFVCASAHEEYLARNPNGAVSPFGVKTLGHAAGGSDKRNPYGEAFGDAGHAYTPSLCAADADGDGFSNGFEMGDECCLWSNAPNCSAAVLTTMDLSFPGDVDSKPRSRKNCACVANGTLPLCACCSMAPCGSGGGGGGGGGDDDDDDDIPTWAFFAGGGGAVAVAAAVGAWCVVSRRAKGRAAALRANGGLQREEESADLYATLN